MRTRFTAGWQQVVACFLMMGTGGMIASAYGVVAVPLSHAFHPSRMVLMLVMTIMTASSGLLSPLLGNLMDRFSLRWLMGFGAALIVAGFLALSFVTSFDQVFVVYGVFMAIANILVGPMAASVLLPRWFVKRRGTALGIAISGVAMGTVVFPPLIQALFDHSDWRTALRLLALITGLCTLPATALIVNRPADKGLHPDGADQEPKASGSANDAPLLSVREILRDPTFWMTGATVAVVLSGMMGMVTNLVPLAIDQGIKPTAAALLISVYAACGFVAKLTFAAVADRVNLRHLFFLILSVFTIGMACFIHTSGGYWQLAIGAGLIGTGGVMIPLQGLLVPRVFGKNVVGRVSGLLNMVVLSALLITPSLFGLIFDLTGKYDAVFIFFTALVAATMLIVPNIRLQPKSLAPEGHGEIKLAPM